jgi:hypothetical protein
VDVFALFVFFVDQPLLAIVPAALFACSALAAREWILWIAAAAWLTYGLYELGNSSGLLCSGDCNIRADLLFIAPILLMLSFYALASWLWRNLRRKVDHSE